MLISMDNLTASFYQQPEMVAYHQAAYDVQYVLKKYGVEKFTGLWKHGFAAFEKIYRVPFLQVKTDINTVAKQDYPVVPPITWNAFKEGCL